MKQRLILILLVGLIGCSQEEAKHQQAALTNQVDALQKEKDEFQKKLAAQEQELAALRQAKSGEPAQPAVEAVSEPAPAPVATISPEAFEQQKKEMAEMQTKFQAAQSSVDKLAFLTKEMTDKKATIHTSLGDIQVKFYPEVAPIHCFNFITRAESGFYNKTQFHRVIPGFMIQGGDPNSRDLNFDDDGGGGTAVAIPNEFNSMHHKRGILSMARRGDPKVGAGSQFFLMHADSPQLDNQYTVFGEVISGMDIVDKIVSVKRNFRDHPEDPVWIESVTLP